MFVVHTNTGTRYVSGVSDAEMRAAMFAYIREWRAAGKSLASAVYCWARVPVGGTPPTR